MQSIFNHFLITIIFLVSSLSCFAFDSLRLEKKKGEWLVIHQVDQGETLYALSKRYESSIEAITEQNGLTNGQLSLFQEIAIPVSKDFAKNNRRGQPSEAPKTDNISMEEVVDSSSVVSSSSEEYTVHLVKAKETLFSISKKYNVTIDALKNRNDLSSNALALGQELIIPSEINSEKDDLLVVGETYSSTAPVDELFSVYFVQNGDILETIAAKFKVRPDSIIYWNELQNTYLSIGQKLKVRGEIDSLGQTLAPNIHKLSYGTRRKSIDHSGFTKIYEEGVALKIDSPITSNKSLALHRHQPIGSMLEVRNLMNNKMVLVKVVGKLPETGLNKNVLIRLTPVTFDKLGVLDPKARVEVSYYE